MAFSVGVVSIIAISFYLDYSKPTVCTSATVCNRSKSRILLGVYEEETDEERFPENRFHWLTQNRSVAPM